ncbi:hypothetical protein LF845_03700 [Deferribacterales bacterium Es71-Z0220]|uniref:hypothetical protein n=1 Tax=Deferrivibrio essentukiensis TaxID=2880922 RepID=UPI001F615C4B|nr:hypothetical protein [Deferrivibrio essentukiensis]MCB4204063.1 hypothetical protein [Deferrivibrio essentukiensis]
MGNLFLFLIDFFKEVENPKDYEETIEKYLIVRTLTYLFLSIFIMLLWGLFDYFIDYENFRYFIKLRVSYAVVVFIILIIYSIKNMPYNYYKVVGFLNYALLVVAVLPMLIATSEKLSYFLGFSVIFFGTSIIMIWPVIYMVIPMVVSFVLYMFVFDINLFTKESIVITIFMPTVFLVSLAANILVYNEFMLTSYLIKKLNSKSE